MCGSTVINSLIAKYGDQCVIYYFFDFKETEKQGVEGLVASLIAQLVATCNVLPEMLLSLYERHKLRNLDRPSPATVDELLTVLIHLLNRPTATFIIIDALDESDEREPLLQSIYTIFDNSGTNCKYFFSSRAEKDLEVAMEGLNVKHLPVKRNAVDQDVGIYVRAMMETHKRLCAHRQGIKDLITNTLIEGANGM